MVEIEIARDKMDGVEFGRRSSVQAQKIKQQLNPPQQWSLQKQHQNRHGRGHGISTTTRIIKMSNLDQAPVSHSKVAYYKIKIDDVNNDDDYEYMIDESIEKKEEQKEENLEYNNNNIDINISNTKVQFSNNNNNKNQT